jgi:hypothetical protein
MKKARGDKTPEVDPKFVPYFVPYQLDNMVNMGYMFAQSFECISLELL